MLEVLFDKFIDKCISIDAYLYCILISQRMYQLKLVYSHKPSQKYICTVEERDQQPWFRINDKDMKELSSGSTPRHACFKLRELADTKYTKMHNFFGFEVEGMVEFGVLRDCEGQVSYFTLSTLQPFDMLLFG